MEKTHTANEPSRVNDVVLIHAAYEQRMKAMNLSAADLQTYIHVTNQISPWGGLLGGLPK